MFRLYRKCRRLNSCRSISHYISTPIFYVNSSPHIGHVHTLLLADAINIYQRLKLNAQDTIFSTGTDEHGIKVQTAAELNKTTYQDFCDQNSKKFLNLFNQYDTTLTDFIRTSEERHKEAVSFVWRHLQDKGLIYKSTYSGWYCNSDETFVPESQLTQKVVNGQVVHVDQNENPVVWTSEENYLFRLSQFKYDVADWLTSQKPLIPEKFNDEAIKIVKNLSLDDLSVSRPTKRLKWGVQVPNDHTQTIYVWLDALTNYLTVVGYPCKTEHLKRWPVDCQVIGKDIIKFHAIYWPAFLLALSLPLPKKLVCHSHWLVDSYKMSKSRGNVVDPLEENQRLTTEGLRYYLLRAATPHSDTDYSAIQAFRKINAELADTYGNLVSRCCAPAINPQQVIPTKLIEEVAPSVLELKERLNQISEICDRHYDSADFYKGVDELMSVLRFNNAIYEETKPWKLIKEINKDSRSFTEYSNLQTITFETLRVCSILLQPIIPRLSCLVLDRLNVHERSWKEASPAVVSGDPESCQRYINKNTNPVVFPRIKAI